MKKQNFLKLQADDFAMALQEMNTLVDVSIDDLMQLQQSAEKYALRRRTATLLIETVMMQPVISVHPECTLSDAAHLLVTNKISGLPVVDNRSKLVGIITEADFLRALGIAAHHTNHSLWQTLENLFNQQVQVPETEGLVADLMMSNVITVSPQQTLHQALELMKHSGIKRLVVCDQEDYVLGIVTRSDLLRIFFDHFKSKNQ